MRSLGKSLDTVSSMHGCRAIPKMKFSKNMHYKYCFVYRKSIFKWYTLIWRFKAESCPKEPKKEGLDARF
jgi:hypothetical protein